MSWLFPPLPVHVRRARTRLQSWMAHHNIDQQTADDTAVVFSELATNAVLHGRGPVAVSVGLESGLIVCAVSDEALDLPVLLAPGADDEHHRGLSLVEALASSWQVHRRPEGGKTVTFTIRARHHAPAARPLTGGLP